MIPEVILTFRIEHLDKTLPGPVEAAERCCKRGEVCLHLLPLKESILSLSCCGLISIKMAKAIGMGNSLVVIRR